MQDIFRRYEKKYMISREQYAALQSVLCQHMTLDQYGEYLVQNLYFDTDGWDAIRASIEGPTYKEKLRMRCYGTPAEDGTAFLELKKKYKGVVYKRRVALPLSASRDLRNDGLYGALKTIPCQIAKELAFYLNANGVSEKVYISYRRLAFTAQDADPLRVTFDTDIRFRLDRLGFERPERGRPLLPDESVLMEIKTPYAIPLWLSRALSENSVFPTPFSKVGKCYAAFKEVRLSA